MIETSKEVGFLNTSPGCEVLHVPQISIKVGKPYHKSDSHRPVSFLMESEVFNLIDAARSSRNGDRDSLLIEVTFKCCLRISETLALTPSCLGKVDQNHVLAIKNGKGHKLRIIGINQTLYDRLLSYAYNKIKSDEKYFNFTRFRGLQIIKEAAIKTGIDNRRIYAHLLRHSGAVCRLKKTGNIESLKRFMGHTDHKMTLRYQTTLQMCESIEIESAVEFER